LTFGGAYTAIAFVRDVAVNANWLTPQQFVDSIAITSVVPTPLVMFVSFVGYISGLNNGGYILAFAGCLLMSFGMFLPAFSITFIGHNLFERIVKVRFIKCFLDGVTASVIGLILVSGIDIMKSSFINVYSSGIFFLSFYSLYLFNHKGKII
jgi:chromate transporter